MKRPKRQYSRLCITILEVTTRGEPAKGLNTEFAIHKYEKWNESIDKGEKSCAPIKKK